MLAPIACGRLSSRDRRGGRAGTEGEGPPSPVLAALAKPSVATKPPAVQADLLGLVPGGPGSLAREGSRVVVTVRFAGGLLGGLADLHKAGGRIISASGTQQTATVSVSAEDLQTIASVPGVSSVWQQREPIAYATNCDGGSVLSEGVGQLRVAEARQAFELRGKGLTVGVLSDSYNTASEAATHAGQDIASADLPGLANLCSDETLPVKVLAEGPAGGDEGRAMLQIVHDVAPHASLAFASAFLSEESFASNIEELARPVAEGGAGADVVVDDVAWFEEPFFQDGPVAVAINKVAAGGVSYLTAAGNDNLFDSSGHEIASWEAPAFRDSGACPSPITALGGFNGSHCMDFNPGPETDRTFSITVEPGRTLTVDLQWAEPWNGVATDLDAFLLSGNQILTGSAEENSGHSGTQRPVEILQWENETGAPKVVQLAINRFSGLNPRLKFILLENGSGVSATEYPESSGGDVVGPAIFGHAGASSAISVAAVPFNNSSVVEKYSSRGPVTHYFGPAEGLTPALPLVSPEAIAKPDLAATDCGATTFFAFLSGGTWRFCGTSAAAPHAAAVAALVRQAKPSLSEEQVRKALTDTARNVGSFPATAAGEGLVDAFEAIASLPGPIQGGDGASKLLPVEQPKAPVQESTAESVPSPTPTSPPTAPAVPTTFIVKHPPKSSGRAAY